MLARLPSVGSTFESRVEDHTSTRFSNYATYEDFLSLWVDVVPRIVQREFASKLISVDKEEVIQEVWVLLLQRRVYEQYNRARGTALTSYLYGRTRYLIWEVLRKSLVAPTEESLTDMLVAPSDSLTQLEDSLTIFSFLHCTYQQLQWYTSDIRSPDYAKLFLCLAQRGLDDEKVNYAELGRRLHYTRAGILQQARRLQALPELQQLRTQLKGDTFP